MTTMDMQPWQKRVRDVMRRKNLRQEDVVAKIGHGQSWLSNKLTNNRGTKIDDISKIAKAIGESESFILTGQRIKPNSAQDESGYVPLIHWEDISAWPENSQHAEILEWIVPASPENLAPSSYALQFRDHSMTSSSGKLSIPKGAKVIVSPCDSADPGTIVLALVAGTPVIRTLGSDGIDLYLQPHNELYPSRPVDIDVQILGIIDEIKFRLRDLT